MSGHAKCVVVPKINSKYLQNVSKQMRKTVMGVDHIEIFFIIEFMVATEAVIR